MQTTTLSRLRAATILTVIILAGCASGQAGPPPKPGEEITTWVRMEQGWPGQTIYFRNDSNRPMVITAIEVFNCVNIGRSGCQYFHPNLLLQPRSVRQVMTLVPADRGKSFSFQYRYSYTAVD